MDYNAREEAESNEYWHQKELDDAVSKAYTKGFKAGQIKMRNEAAHKAHCAMYDLTMGKAGGDTSKLSPHECCYTAQSAIRALPITEEAK